MNSQHKRSFWTILFVGFLDNLSVGILLPLVPLLLTSHHSVLSILPSNLTDAQGYILFGYLLATYTVAQFLATPILGELSDHYGRKPILIASLAGTSFAYLLFGLGVLTANIPLLFIARALDGITGGNISVAQAVVADITDPKEKAKYYGYFGSALGVGFALGPIIGAFFSNSHVVSWFNATTPFWVTASLALLSAILVTTVLKETFTPKTDKIKLTVGNSINSIFDAFRIPHARRLFSGIFVWRTGFGFWTTFAVVFLTYRFGLNQAQLGTYFLYTGSWLILSQLFLVRYIAKKLSKEKILYWSIFLAGAGFITFLIPRDWHYLFLIIPLLASTNALTFANIPAVVSDAADHDTQGKYSGMNNSVQALALSISPILSGYISASLSPLMVVTLSSVLMIISGTILVSYKSQKDHHEENH
jgi:DHA1 family tetracycline resistance protein-like MFS transporter